MKAEELNHDGVLEGGDSMGLAEQPSVDEEYAEEVPVFAWRKMVVVSPVEEELPSAEVIVGVVEDDVVPAPERWFLISSRDVGVEAAGEAKE